MATFSEPNAAKTEVLFSDPGTYLVKLSADDGEFEICDTVEIEVENDPGSDPNRIELTPIDDATVEGSNGINNDVIKVQLSGPARTGYLKFEVDGVGNAKVIDAKLMMTVSQIRAMERCSCLKERIATGRKRPLIPVMRQAQGHYWISSTAPIL